jgi:hypothetical protein
VLSDIIEGRVVRKTSNALQMTFLDGPDGEPMAVAVQGGADSKASKFGVLLGFGSYPQPLKLPLLGVRVQPTRALTETERDVVLAASVDLAIGLRPYVAEMR